MKCYYLIICHCEDLMNFARAITAQIALESGCRFNFKGKISECKETVYRPPSANITQAAMNRGQMTHGYLNSGSIPSVSMKTVNTIRESSFPVEEVELNISQDRQTSRNCED